MSAAADLMPMEVRSVALPANWWQAVDAEACVEKRSPNGMIQRLIWEALEARVILWECPSAAQARQNWIVGNVLPELEKALVKFPTWPTDPLHALAVLGEEFGELTKDALQLTYEPHKTSPDNVRTEAIQTAAMALRFAMSLDSYVYRPGVQHEQFKSGGAQPDTGGAS